MVNFKEINDKSKSVLIYFLPMFEEEADFGRSQRPIRHLYVDDEQCIPSFDGPSLWAVSSFCIGLIFLISNLVLINQSKVHNT